MAVLVLWVLVPSLLASPPSATAQVADTTELRGAVLLDRTPVGGTRVTLHRVTPTSSGEIASDLTDPSGTFRFALEPLEGASFSVFFVTAEYLGIRYFGRPIHSSEAADDYSVLVYDTVSVLPEPVRVVRRDVVMLPELSGAWEVNEILQISNPVAAALVAPPGSATWEFRILSEATDFEAAEGGGILPHEVTRMDDRVLLITPVTPGQRELFIRYRLPDGPATSLLRIQEPTDTLNFFVRQPSHLTGVSGLQTTRLVEAADESFLQYGGLAIAPGATIELQWGRAAGPPVDPIVAAVAVTLIFLALGLVAAVRNRSLAASRSFDPQSGL